MPKYFLKEKTIIFYHDVEVVIKIYKKKKNSLRTSIY